MIGWASQIHRTLRCLNWRARWLLHWVFQKTLKLAQYEHDYVFSIFGPHFGWQGDKRSLGLVK